MEPNAFEDEGIATAERMCPKCGSYDVRRSRGGGLRASLARVFGRYPLRCRSCRRRFFGLALMPLRRSSQSYAE
jgi:transposase-like protein